MSERFDVVVVGAGTAGIPTALEAAAAGARVLLVEKDHRLGGTLHTTGGHVVGAGTRRQREHGIEDTREAWAADIRRITRDGYRPDIIDPVVEHATELVDWLDDLGFRFDPATPRIIYGHEPYYTPRTYYGVDAGVSILDVLTPLLDEHVAAGRITLWTDAPVLGLLQDDPDSPGTVTGVEVLHRGKDVDVHADAVVLATGGFGADAELFAELEGFPLVSGAHPTSTGDGLMLAQAAGAAFQGEGLYLPTFGGLPHPTTPGRVQWEERPLLTQERPPWEIYVDRHGRRWVAEDEPSIDAKERALVARTDDLTFWTIIDDRGVDESVPLVVNWTPDDVRAKANVREGVTKADTLAELAALTGVDEAGLLDTVARYNDMVARGEDVDFGRTHLPAPIEKPPFYAMRNHGVTLVTFVGVDVDGDLRARREDGSPIPGLYAVGEVIGAAATTGQSFCSGMMITPGIVLGRRLGRRLGEQAAPRMTGPVVREHFDVVIIGAGNAGIPAAIEAGRGGARVLLVEKDVRIGGTLFSTGGHLSGAGTKVQARHGIEDSVQAHLEDIQRITHGTHRQDLVELAVTHAADTIDWLDEHGFRFDPATPRIVHGHEPYSVPRSYYGPDGGLSILETLAPLLQEQVDAGTVTLWTDSPVVGLVPAADDPLSVERVLVLRRGEDVEVIAGSVVLATGGFASDKELFEELEGVPLVSAAHPTSTGDGLVMARELGAGLQGVEGKYLPAFGGLPHPTTPGRVLWEDRPIVATTERPPWEIYVDRSGRRWVREDEPSIDAKERALAELPDLTFFIVLDDVAVDASVPMVVNWSPDDVRAKANVRNGVYAADTLEELADLAGIDTAGLRDTVERYNGFVSAGVDPDFDRGFLPAPIATPPFYAMRNHGIALISFAGLDCDGELRIRREDGAAFANLYGIGEVIGSRPVHGFSYLSGMTVTPAIVFGRLLGARLAAATAGG